MRVVSDNNTQERHRKRPQARKGRSKLPPNQSPTASGETTGVSPGGESKDHDRKGGQIWKTIAAITVAVLLGAAAYFGLGGVASDQVTEDQIQNQNSSYQTLIGGSGFPLTYVAPEDIDQAINDMPENVTSEQREQLHAEIKAGRTKLAWLTLWDTHAEDGDVLRFESTASFPIEVSALNAKTTIAIPYPSEGNVVVTGVHDGGGGITIALESGATRINWPTMKPGDTLNLPVTPSF